MPLDSDAVARAMAGGLSAVCATCKKYWEARSAGAPGHVCTSKTLCGSPLAGDDFHDYEGPLLGVLHQWCFVCGGNSKYGIKVKGRTNIIGVCAPHAKYVEAYRAVGRDVPVQAEVRTSEGKELVAPPPPKKNLMAAIQEVEDYYASKDDEGP